ncbi:hypothetical protein V7O66_10090 [Methanolobus sp. ZRKC3]|uniref:hypothetical protein n=1 Tax=Methanolobus sp. ZRKC3 TaxID=3125786 RepID=UPI00324A382E
MKGNKLIIVLLLFFLVQPVMAYEWDNDIDVGPNSMSWKYTESYSGDHSVIFKTFIDSELGNGDGFVSAWELLKIDVKSRATFSDSISREIDVVLDASSDLVHLLSVESELSPELVGPINSSRNIVNVYEINYSFDDALPSNGSIWFRGQSRSDVTITLPEGFSITGTQGLDRSKVYVADSRPTVSGVFGQDELATVSFVMIVTQPDEEKAPEINNSSVTEVSDDRAPSLIDDIFPGLTDSLARKLKSSS